MWYIPIYLAVLVKKLWRFLSLGQNENFLQSRKVKIWRFAECTTPYKRLSFISPEAAEPAFWKVGEGGGGGGRGGGKAVPKMIGKVSYLEQFFRSSNLLFSKQFLDRRFPKILLMLFEGHTNVSEHFSNFSEDKRSFEDV